MRSLYERGYSRAVVIELFRIIDWLVQLPEGLEKQFLAEVHELEEEGKMPFVAPAERIWEERGAQKGEAAILLGLLEARFGALDAATQEHVQAADSETLQRWALRVLTAASLEEVFGTD